MTCDRSNIYRSIDAERTRQSEKWSAPHAWGQGDCSSDATPPIVKAVVLTEEVGEVARAVLDNKTQNLRTELIQVAAVAVAWLESL